MIYKIPKEHLRDLMTKPLFQLSPDEIDSLAFILDITISDVKEGHSFIQFKMHCETSSAIVKHLAECTFIEMGRNTRSRNGVSNMTCFGGSSSFADAVQIFRAFFCRGGYEITIESEDKLQLYGDKEYWKVVSKAANDMVEEERPKKTAMHPKS